MPSVGKRVISPPIKHVISYSSEGLRGTSSTSVVTVSDEPVNSLMRILFQTFMNSLKPRQLKGNLVGEDYFGNKVLRNPGKLGAWADAQPALVRTLREKEAYNQEVTAEWEAWLRGRRKEPPTEQELLRNLAIMKLKEKNAAELEAKHAKPKDLTELEKEPDRDGFVPQLRGLRGDAGQGKA
ncbi:hypothetical protein quinque_000156 [Culex quinquefasciatus]